MTQHIDAQAIGELNPPNRLMLTPGPSSMDPRVYRALASPLVGHLDPWFKGCMDDTQVLLRQIFQTENRLTMPLSASGSGGIEASVVNTLEEGDEAIVCVNGVFSERMAVIASHTPAKVTKVEAPYGKPVDAEDVRRAGKGKVQSSYFDLTTSMNYWGKDRLYLHTPPVSLIYALREAMRIVMEEGLETRWERHRVNQLALIAGIEAMGLELLVKKPADRLPTVTAVMIPDGIDDAKVRNQLLDEFNIEIAGGLGPLKSKIWRIGLMGHCSQKPYVLLFLAALGKTLLDQGFRLPSGAGVAAAVHSYAHARSEAVAVSR